MGNSPSCDERCREDIADAVIRRLPTTSCSTVTETTCPTTEDIRATIMHSFPILNLTADQLAGRTANMVNFPTATQIATETANTITCPTTTEIVNAMPIMSTMSTCPTAREIATDVLWHNHFLSYNAQTSSSSSMSLGDVVGNHRTQYQSVTQRIPFSDGT